jgi:hypothetical protein
LHRRRAKPRLSVRPCVAPGSCSRLRPRTWTRSRLGHRSYSDT